MKIIVVIIGALLIFFACGVVGYSIASNNNLFRSEESAEPVETEGGEQYSLLIVQVDQLDALKPRLVSVWYASLFFMDGTPPTLTFAQLYAPYSEKESAQRLEQAFSLKPGGEPTTGFLRSVSNLKIRWDSYVVVDHFSTQRILEWVNGPGEYTQPFEQPQETTRLLEQTCQSLSNVSNREVSPFDWAGLAPHHFYSNLRFEMGLSYWNRMTGSTEPVRCHVILAQ